MSRIYVLGVGPGGAAFVPPRTVELAGSCDLLVGGKRNLSLFDGLTMEKREIGRDIPALLDFVEGCYRERRVGILVSGDPGLFSLLGPLRRRFSAADLEIIPATSALQYLFARIAIPWHDAHILSLHGRRGKTLAGELAEAVRQHTKVVLFTDGNNTPALVCELLLQQGVSNCKIYIGENLSYPEEKLYTGSLEDCRSLSVEPLNIMVILNECKEQEAGNRMQDNPPWDYVVPGIPDEHFCRGEVPLTKEEIRALSLSRLRLQAHHTLLDVGAGTGSVSIESALLLKQGKVIAVEKDPEALALLEQNARLFAVNNLEIIPGSAPGALAKVEQADCIFIGGTGGQMGEILKACSSILAEGGMLVINCILLESLASCMKQLSKLPFTKPRIISAAIARGQGLGEQTMLRPLNPVFIIAAQKNSNCV